MPFYPFKVSHIQDGTTLAALQPSMGPIKVKVKYFDYADICPFDLAMELPENTRMNKYVIVLIDGKQPLYGSIYALNSMDLKTLKTYIKIYLKTGFIRPSNFPTGAPLLFAKKPNESFCLYVNYLELKNLIIKN